MHFYVDETGQTGRNLFDKTQPVLSYGVLSSDANLDKVAEADLAVIGVGLGNGNYCTLGAFFNRY